ncbi:MAG: hypothetical protein P9L97_04015 [Candidatus Tenebribacter davisii]|jgi:hypothetical protein|nr:hypothetical protein [Candidatus Tenebribacter davisii]
MILLVILIIIIVTFVLIKQSNKSTPQKKLKKVIEDPFETSLEYEKETNLNIQYPLFYFLKHTNNFSNLLNPEELQLSKQIVLINDEDAMSEITKLIKETKPRRRNELPKFLQILPINQLIKSKILVHPDRNDLSSLLSIFIMSELKEFCQLAKIKSCKSKKETINSMIKKDLSEIITFNDFFKINPIIKGIYNKLADFSFDYLENKINNLKEIEFQKINGRIDKSELGDSINVNNARIQNYGYSSVIWFKDNEPHFRILGVSINGFTNNILLLRNGFLSIFQQLNIGDWALSRVTLINDKPEVLSSYEIKTPKYVELKELMDAHYLTIELENDRFWCVNYSTLAEEYFENPMKSDIYSVIENKETK